MIKTTGLIEQHIHGAFGIDFMRCSREAINICAEKLFKNGIVAFFPTIMTDDINIIKERISVIKDAQSMQCENEAEIIGVHLEGPFINPEKAGIHEKKYILPLDINLFKEIEDDIIKIVTLAPELDTTGEFIKYLCQSGIKVSAGHCTGYDFKNISQVTHLYNAMGGFTHRGGSTVISALTIDDVYTEIIADSMHVDDEVLKITFKQKPKDKIILISDALPLAHSDLKEITFAGQTIYNKDGKAINTNGTLAGSSMLICDVVKNLVTKKIMTFEDAVSAASSNIIKYHGIKAHNVYWDENLNPYGNNLL